jgi:hypothetical protein
MAFSAWRIDWRLTAAVAAIASLALVSTTAWSRTRDAPKPPLNGGFIQYDEDVLKEITAKKWGFVLSEMQTLGMKTVIVQYLGVAKDAAETPPPFLFEEVKKKCPSVIDPTPIILGEAKARGLDVYLGLLFPPEDSKGSTNARPGFWKPGNLATFAKANCTFAKQVADKYRGRFQGWYVPLENWVGKYSGGDVNEYVDDWRAFYANVAEVCKTEQPSLPVAISPCLPDRAYSGPDPKTAAEVYGKMLTGRNIDKKIDIVMLQDSVGEKPETWTPTTSAAHLAPLVDVCHPKGIRVWSNVESFERRGNDRLPCRFARFKSQIEAAQGVEARVTFDFFHYMNGRVHLKRWCDIDDYIARMADLHCQYRNTYIK